MLKNHATRLKNETKNENYDMKNRIWTIHTGKCYIEDYY